MMVERSSRIENMSQLLQDINQATAKINEFNSNVEQKISKQDLNDLIHVLHHFNTALDSGFWTDKKLALEGMSTIIEKALNAVHLFQLNQPQVNQAMHKNVTQAILSLISTLTNEMMTFDKNLRDLKKYKIGQHVENVHKSDGQGQGPK